MSQITRARICKRLRSPEIDSDESIPPAYVAWRADMTNKLTYTGPPGWESIPGLLKRFTNTGLEVKMGHLLCNKIGWGYRIQC